MDDRFGGFEDWPGGDSEIARLGETLGASRDEGAGMTGSTAVELCSIVTTGGASALGETLTVWGGGAEAAEPPTVSEAAAIHSGSGKTRLLADADLVLLPAGALILMPLYTRLMTYTGLLRSKAVKHENSMTFPT